MTQNLSASQRGQSVELPTVREYFPVSQTIQSVVFDFPGNGLYVPPAQEVGVVVDKGQN